MNSRTAPTGKLHSATLGLFILILVIPCAALGGGRIGDVHCSSKNGEKLAFLFDREVLVSRNMVLDSVSNGYLWSANGDLMHVFRCLLALKSHTGYPMKCFLDFKSTAAVKLALHEDDIYLERFSISWVELDENGSEARSKIGFDCLTTQSQ